MIAKLAPVAILAVATTAWGHDYWLDPGKAPGAIGREVIVRMFRGEALESDDERPLQVARTERFALIRESASIDLLADARDEKTPVATLHPGRGRRPPPGDAEEAGDPHAFAL